MDLIEVLKRLRMDFNIISKKFHSALALGDMEAAKKHYIHGENVKAQIINVKKQIKGEN